MLGAGLVVWGGGLILGPTFVLIGVALHAVTAAMRKLDERAFPLAAQEPSAAMTRPQRVSLALGVPLVMLALLLSAALLLRGETLF
jgi:type IV secretory pathway VirB3-like protein